MNRILTGWSLIRVFYLLLGGLIFIQSLVVMEWLGIIFGGYFAAMGLFGFGCASGQCYPTVNKNIPGVNDPIEVEEIKNQ